MVFGLFLPFELLLPVDVVQPAPTRHMPRINPAIIVWARQTAGLTPDQAIAKLDIKDARGVSALDRLAALESGAEVPSRALLIKMAKQYRRPLLVFYMSAPPRRGDRGQDFRTLPVNRSPAPDALLDVLIRDIKARQSMVRAVLEDEDETERLRFVGSASMADGTPAVVESIERTIRVTRAEFRAKSSIDDAFALLRDGAEGAGVFVLLIGNLGSHHTSFEVETFRGFALADPIAPFVVINDQDAKSAWSFTLLHELAHLWLGATGVSGTYSDVAIERFCNEIASAFLLADHEVDSLGRELARFQGTARAYLKWVADRISTFAGERNLSRAMVIYRLYTSGAISQQIWQILAATFRDEYLREREARRERDRELEGGPSYYIVRRHRLGRALLDLVRRTMTAGALTPTQAGRVLGVKPRNVEPLLAMRGP